MIDIFASDAIRDSGGSPVSRLPLYLGYRAWTQQLRYPTTFASLLAANRLYNPSYALASDPDWYEVILRDAVVRQCADIRLRAAAGRDWRLEPGNETQQAKRLASIVEEALRHIQRFTEARYELASAVIRGTSYGYVCGRRRVISLGGVTANWWIPHRIDDVDPRRIVRRIERTESGAETCLALWDLDRREWVDLPRAAPLIRIVYNDEEARLGYGRGLGEAVYHVVWASNEIAQLIHEAIGMHARGILRVALDPTAAGSQSTAERQAEWERAVQLMRVSNLLTHDKRDEIDWLQGGSEVQYALDVLRYYDDLKRSLLLGAKLPFGGGDQTGSYAQAREQSDVAESIVQFDRDKLCEDLSRDLIGCFLRHNQPQLDSLGLASVPAPRFSPVHEKRHDPRERAATAAALLALPGVRLRRAEVIEGAGYTVPREGDDVLEGSTPAAESMPPAAESMPPVAESMPVAESGQQAQAVVGLLRGLIERHSVPPEKQEAFVLTLAGLAESGEVDDLEEAVRLTLEEVGRG